MEGGERSLVKCGGSWGAPGLPARSPKCLRKIPWGFMLSLGNTGEMRWGVGGPGRCPPPCSRSQGIRAALGLLLAHLEPQQTTWHWKSMGAPVLVPSPGHTCPHLLVLVPSSCPTCLLLPLIPSPKICLLVPLVLVPWSYQSLLPVQLVSIS